jgi:hypothetical protein
MNKMKKLIAPAKSNFMLQVGHDYLHHETTEWLSELEFCKTELSFLTKLLDKAFLRVRGKLKVNELTEIEKKVKSFRTKTLKLLHDGIIAHEQHLGALDELTFKQDEESTREEHRKYSSAMKEFTLSIKEIKKEIFEIVETQVKLVKKVANDYEDGTLAL